MAAATAKRIWEVCEPHRDVFARDPDPSLFAISLHHVAQGSADRDYTDAERFFSRTYMTRALLDLLERVVGRLSGHGQGAPILRLETPFGGGKTHTMTALFHVARSPEALSEHRTIRPILERLNLRTLPVGVRTAVLDGRGLDARERRTEEGLTVRTLWGELAYQLGGRQGYDIVADADRTRTSPGGTRLTQLLQRCQPVLILMDEVLEYLIKARAVRVGDSNLMEQTGTFLGELTSAVIAVPKSVLVVALPASSLEVSTESQETAERLFQYAKKVFGRVELVETPVAQDEVFGVLRCRLFRDVGTERARKRAVERMRGYYDEYARFFPDRVRSPNYKERMLRAYPFHPELVDLLYERWGPHPQFQRTRGALRLLALVLRRLWKQRPGSAFLIQPHHIDLADRHIRGEVVRLLDSGWDAIVTGDVLQRAGEIERELGGDYTREQLGKGAATCAFLYSISAATRDAGATEEEIRTALLRPPINPAMASEVLGRLREGLWYLRYRDRRYLFTARPNLNKVILDFESEVTDEQVDESFRNWLDKVAGTGSGVFHVVASPAGPELVPDRQQPTLVLVPVAVGNATEWMEKALQSAGDRPRVNRNMLVFLAPDRTRMPALRAALRRWQALKAIERSPSFKELDADDKQQVRQQLKDKETEIEALLKQTYPYIYRPGVGGLRKVTAQPPEVSRASTLAEFVAEALEQAGELLEQLAPEYLADVLPIKDRGEVPVSQAVNLFTGTTGQPLLKDTQLVYRAIQEGIRSGTLAVRVQGTVHVREDIPEDLLKDQTATLLPPDVEPPPPPPKEPQRVTLVVRTTGKLLYPLLQALDRIRDLQDVSVSLQVHDETGGLRRLKDELDGLFRDYGCTFEWNEAEPRAEG